MSLSVEDLQCRKASILKYINIGLGIDTAYTLAGISEEEKVELASDATFQELITAGNASLEYELLQNVHKVMDFNTRRGKSDEARWLLGIINPARYAGKKEIAVGNGSVTIQFGKDYDGI